MTPIIRTFTGKLVNPLDLKLEDIDIVDIAHHLSCINRFNGALHEPINVACHSIAVAFYTQYMIDDPTIVCQALLHDATEAYLGDITKWLKQSPEMEKYREAEDRAHRVIMDVFGLPHDLHPVVQEGDRVLVTFEGQYGFGDPEWPHLEKYPALTDTEQEILQTWRPLDWTLSKSAFLHTYEILIDRINGEAESLNA